MGSNPTMDKKNPKIPAMNPFITAPSEIFAIMDKPNIARAKYSAEPNLNANSATQEETNRAIVSPIIPPKNEEIVTNREAADQQLL